MLRALVALLASGAFDDAGACCGRHRFPAAGFAADFTLFFTVVSADFARAFVAAELKADFEAGLSVFVMVFANLAVTVFGIDFLAGVPAASVFGVAAFAADLFTLLITALFVADLVTVALMVSSFQ